MDGVVEPACCGAEFCESGFLGGARASADALRLGRSTRCRVRLWDDGGRRLLILAGAQTFSTSLPNPSLATSPSFVRPLPSVSVLRGFAERPSTAGAFSAYRYIALQNDALGHGPLASYFKGEKLEGADSDVFVRLCPFLLRWLLMSLSIRPPTCTWLWVDRSLALGTY